MPYRPELGLWGNLNLALKSISKETNERRAADTENREAVEQSMTDYELDMIQTQQDLTDLQIQILEGTK